MDVTDASGITSFRRASRGSSAQGAFVRPNAIMKPSIDLAPLPKAPPFSKVAILTFPDTMSANVSAPVASPMNPSIFA